MNEDQTTIPSSHSHGALLPSSRILWTFDSFELAERKVRTQRALGLQDEIEIIELPSDRLSEFSDLVIQTSGPVELGFEDFRDCMSRPSRGGLILTFSNLVRGTEITIRLSSSSEEIWGVSQLIGEEFHLVGGLSLDGVFFEPPRIEISPRGKSTLDWIEEKVLFRAELERGIETSFWIGKMIQRFDRGEALPSGFKITI